MNYKHTYDVITKNFKPLFLAFNSFALISMCLFFFTVSAIGQENEKKNKQNLKNNQKTILVMGDSLSAGYGLPPGESFPDKLNEWLLNNQINANVINAGVSGDTSQGGNSRLEWVYTSLPNGRPDLVIIEFGGNDALRGIEPALTKKNLEEMIVFLKDKNTPILLAGMQAPPNMGADYEKEFNQLFPDLASHYDIGFYPFFLEGVGGVPSLNQRDGIHPNEEGVKVIVEKISPYVVSFLVGK